MSSMLTVKTLLIWDQYNVYYIVDDVKRCSFIIIILIICCKAEQGRPIKKGCS